MSNTVCAAVIAVLLATANSRTCAAPPRFEKVRDHFYYLQSAGDGGNVGAVVTDEGVLLIDTQSQSEAPGMLEALKRVTAKPVRWVVNTHFHEDHTGGNASFSRLNAAVIGSRELRRLMLGAHRNLRGSRQGGEIAKQDEVNAGADLSVPRFGFGRQVRLFPAGLEVRVFAVEHQAHTGGDVVVFVPAEKVLQVGDLFVAGSYPSIDSEGGEGSALGWIDGMRQVIEAVPLLKSAMPQPKPVAGKTPSEEKTLEESVVVIPGHGPASNLQEMKNLLETSQKLRAEIARAVAAGRNRDSLLSSLSLAPYRGYRNLESYASLLYDALIKK